MVLNVFIEKKFDEVCAKTKILCNTEILIFFIIPLLLKLALLLYKFIIKF